jgi:hypothetical protein
MEPGTSRLEALWHCIGSWFKGLKASSLNTKKNISIKSLGRCRVIMTALMQGHNPSPEIPFLVM